MRTTSATIEMSGVLWINQQDRTFWAVSDGENRGFELLPMPWADCGEKLAVGHGKAHPLQKYYEMLESLLRKGFLHFLATIQSIKLFASSPPFHN